MSEFWLTDATNLLAITGMAIVTLATRWTGYLLVGHFKIEGRLKGALEAVPPAVLTSLVVPMAVATGIAESIAAVITIVAAWRLPTIVAVVTGVASVVVFRLFLPI